VIQDPKTGPAPPGVVYNTSMARPDAALALAALYVSAARRDARVNGICISGSGFDAAVFCDIVARFYTGTTRAPSSNAALPIGFPADPPVPANPAMVETAVNRKSGDGQPQYVRTILHVSDTSAPDALLRNAITFSAETVVVLSAPATWLARAVSLAGAPAQYQERVTRVVIVEAGDTDRDPGALKALSAAIPVPIVISGREVGEALSVPRARVESSLAWAAANPVADAVLSAGGVDVPLHDVAALHYALHPNSGFFTVANGRLSVVPEKKPECLTELLALATSKPPVSPGRGGR
jgi:hypothetical protein